MDWDFQLLVLMIGNVLAQIHELKYMQKHINKGGWNGSNCQRWPASFSVGCIT